MPSVIRGVFSRSAPLAKRGRLAKFLVMSQSQLLEDETLVQNGFWRKVRRTLGKVPFTEDAVAAFYCANDPATPLAIRATLFGALAYFVMPFDASPDCIFGLCYTDDPASLIAAWTTARVHLSEAQPQEAHAS